MLFWRLFCIFLPPISTGSWWRRKLSYNHKPSNEQYYSVTYQIIRKSNQNCGRDSALVFFRKSGSRDVINYVHELKFKRSQYIQSIKWLNVKTPITRTRLERLCSGDGVLVVLVALTVRQKHDNVLGGRPVPEAPWEERRRLPQAASCVGAACLIPVRDWDVVNT